jgi:hypothetical protein
MYFIFICIVFIEFNDLIYSIFYISGLRSFYEVFEEGRSKDTHLFGLK